jgi:hypothetical protein
MVLVFLGFLKDFLVGFISWRGEGGLSNYSCCIDNLQEPKLRGWEKKTCNIHGSTVGRFASVSVYNEIAYLI